MRALPEAVGEVVGHLAVVDSVEVNHADQDGEHLAKAEQRST